MRALVGRGVQGLAGAGGSSSCGALPGRPAPSSAPHGNPITYSSSATSADLPLKGFRRQEHREARPPGRCRGTGRPRPPPAPSRCAATIRARRSITAPSSRLARRRLVAEAGLVEAAPDLEQASLGPFELAQPGIDRPSSQRSFSSLIRPPGLQPAAFTFQSAIRASRSRPQSRRRSGPGCGELRARDGHRGPHR